MKTITILAGILFCGQAWGLDVKRTSTMPSINTTVGPDYLKGPVGINTTSPATTLDVNGASTLRAAVTVAGSSLTVGGQIAVSAANGQLRFADSTNVIRALITRGANTVSVSATNDADNNGNLDITVGNGLSALKIDANRDIRLGIDSTVRSTYTATTGSLALAGGVTAPTFTAPTDVSGWEVTAPGIYATTAIRLDGDGTFKGNNYFGTAPAITTMTTTGSLALPKIKFSGEGGHLLRLTNASGLVLTTGTVVNSTGSGVDFGFMQNPVGGPQSLGVIYGAINADVMGSCGIGEDCWVCTQGLCAIKIDSGGCATRGLWVGSSASAEGTAECIAEPNPASQHDRELGHIVKAAVGGIAWGVVQFGR